MPEPASHRPTLVVMVGLPGSGKTKRAHELAAALLRGGTSVILDFGLWSRDERSALRSLADEEGAAFQVEYLSVDRDTQWRRIQERQQTVPETTFSITREDLAEFDGRFEEPDEEEIHGGSALLPPEGAMTWSDWRAHRWPTAGEL